MTLHEAVEIGEHAALLLASLGTLVVTLRRLHTHDHDDDDDQGDDDDGEGGDE